MASISALMPKFWFRLRPQAFGLLTSLEKDITFWHVGAKFEIVCYSTCIG